MLIFEVGSLICGVAQNPTVLIVGRAIAGVGGAGVAVGIFTVIGLISSPEKRAQLLGLAGATYGIAAVLGPLLGGAFTDRVTWRWVRWERSLIKCTRLCANSIQCFYINLPVGGLAAIVVMIFFSTPANAKPAQATLREKLLQMDLVGATLMMGLIISYILALQYGGQTHSWNSSVVIGLLVGFVAILSAFVAWELFQKERAMIVPRLVSSPSQVSITSLTPQQAYTRRLNFQLRERYVFVGSVFMFFFGGAYFTILYYLPIYFQAIFDNSPIESGVKMLAFIIPLTFSAIVQGIALFKVGIVPLFWIVGGALGTIGCGLFYTMDQNTSTGKWIAYQIIVGFTSGLTFQVSISNAQIHAAPEDMSQVTAIVQCESQLCHTTLDSVF